MLPTTYTDAQAREGPCGSFSRGPVGTGRIDGAAHFRSGWWGRTADTPYVARQHYIIMIFGILGMVLLSTLMKHFLQVSSERTSPIAAELHADLASEFEREPSYSMKAPAEGKALGVAEVKIFPRLGVSPKPLAKQVGDWIWRRLGGKAERVHVTCVDWSSGAEKMFEISRPYLSAPPGTGTTPSKAPAGSKATKAPGTKTAAPKASTETSAPQAESGQRADNRPARPGK